MAKLIYLMIASLDGYVADEDGNFDWAVPDEDVHAFIDDLDRSALTCTGAGCRKRWSAGRPTPLSPSSRP
jgi:hypothetical protein